jgi:hypothetical protein
MDEKLDFAQMHKKSETYDQNIYDRVYKVLKA